MPDISKLVANLSPEKRALLERMLEKQGVNLGQTIILPQDRTTNTFPLSFSQQRLWFLEQFEPGSPVYNIPCAVKMTGTLNVDALEKSLNAIIKRHEVLRTTFATESEQPIQVIAPALTLPLELVDLRKTPEPEKQALSMRLAVESAQKPFDLSQGPLWRSTLVQFQGDEHLLLLTMHHIVSDGWSLGVLLHEIRAFYESFIHGKVAALPKLSVQYADFACWQRKWMQGEVLAAQLSFWKKQLSGSPPALELITDYPRPAAQTYNGSLQSFKWSVQLLNSLNELARQENATLFMVLLAAFHVLLYRYSGQDDINIGIPIANRNRAETEPLIGFFINTLVMRGDLSGKPTFLEFLARIREATLGAFAHQDLPFEILMEEMHAQRDMSHTPFFQEMFVLNNAPIQALELPGLKLTPVEIDNRTSKFDLVLSMMEEKDGLNGKMEFNTDLFRPSSIERMVLHLQNLVEAIVVDPRRRLNNLRMMGSSERQQVLVEWNSTSTTASANNCLHELLSQQAEKAPDSVAVVLDKEKLTYGELDRRANQLAHHLQRLGVRPEVSVGVCLERSVEMIVSLLGILKAGGVYIPMDPAFPRERLHYMLEDANVSVLITQQSRISDFVSRISENSDQSFPIRNPQSEIRNLKVLCIDSDSEIITRESPDAVACQVFPDNLAYVIYTSGSTGQPKGVLVSRRTIADHCIDMQRHYQLTPNDKVLQFAAANFDASLEQILTTLMTGATLVLRGPEIWATSEFHKIMLEYGLTVINPPTAYWHQLAQEWAESPELVPNPLPRLVIAGGDQMLPEAVNHWRQTPLQSVPLLNAYGPTETVITATTFPVHMIFAQAEIGQRISIGRPLANRKAYILDREGNPVPVGVPGELHLGGNRIARGYLNRAELTAEKFIPDCFSGEAGVRLYKTGDLARYLADGNIEFLGRVDQQVKIRGFRIELGEIESALSQHADVRQAVVLAREDEPGEKRLVAYIVLEEGTRVSTTDLRNYLKDKLPEYMVPAALVVMEQMPVNAVGKIDRNALPAPEHEDISAAEDFVGPRTTIEQTLADIVVDVLKLERVGVHDNFFDLGGHSMMATRVISRLRQIFQVDIPLRSLFEAPTIEGLALSIAKMQAAQEDQDQMNQLLAEIEQLSEADAAELLNNEEDSTLQTEKL